MRAASLSSEPIPFEQHAEWYAAMLADSSRQLYVGEDGDGPVGYVRFDLADDVAAISITVDRARRHQGLGTALIQSACGHLAATRRCREITSVIKPSNRASLAAFQRAGFIVYTPPEPSALIAMRLDPAHALLPAITVPPHHGPHTQDP